MNLTAVEEEESCTQPSNFSCFETASLTAVDVLMYSAAAAVVLLTVCGNLLVIISICHFRQLHTPTNLLLLSLAVADLLVGVLVMPFHFSTLIQSYWCFGAVFCLIWNLASFHLSCVSVYNVTFIAMDRYFALSNPFLYATKITVRVTLMITSIFWLYSLFYNFALLYFNGNIIDVKENVACAGQCSATIDEVWATVDFVTVFILPCLIMLMLYLKIFAIAKYHANAIRCTRKQQQAECTQKSNHSTASERKAAKRAAILILVFFLCLVPYYITVFLSLYIRKASAYVAITATLILVNMNSSLNPLIYALFYTWFQKCVKLIVTLQIRSANSSLTDVLSRGN
ncbi:trace amine-associated receptor 13c-like [Megalops cyprinoides]|uniref:trace amine-associated receptor 13c-like n=1 Tax=Megalops cyprinoides TaxID=118141 RepID=UPI0018649D58|nr:trace amine-associated receptor 13c-like [Megalops cyprinoides]